MGTSEEARDYCKKGDQSHAEWKLDRTNGKNFGKNAKFVETGTFFSVARSGRLCPDQARATGKKGGLKKAEEYRKMIKLSEEGKFDEMKEDFPSAYWLHYNTMKRINMDNPGKVDEISELKNEWIWGEPGTGKSYTARKENKGLFFDKSLNKDWSGYRGEPVIICDDVGKFQVTHGFGDHLKRWGDHYSFPADIKYSGAVIRPQKIVVTSNYSIDQLWAHDEQLVAALKRRFKVRHFTEIFKYDERVEKPQKRKADKQTKVVGESATKKRRYNVSTKQLDPALAQARIDFPNLVDPDTGVKAIVIDDEETQLDYQPASPPTDFDADNCWTQEKQYKIVMDEDTSESEEPDYSELGPIDFHTPTPWQPSQEEEAVDEDDTVWTVHHIDSTDDESD